MISNESTVTSDSIVDEFARFLSREDILTKRLTLAQISERFTDLYRTLRVSDALFEADGDMLAYGIGVAPEIDQIGLVDARGFPKSLSWSSRMRICISFRRQIFPTSEEEYRRMTDLIVLAYFPSTETEPKTILSSGWISHPNESSKLSVFLDDPRVAGFLSQIPERVFSYIT